MAMVVLLVVVVVVVVVVVGRLEMDGMERYLLRGTTHVTYYKQVAGKGDDVETEKGVCARAREDECETIGVKNQNRTRRPCHAMPMPLLSDTPESQAASEWVREVTYDGNLYT